MVAQMCLPTALGDQRAQVEGLGDRPATLALEFPDPAFVRPPEAAVDIWNPTGVQPARTRRRSRGLRLGVADSSPSRKGEFGQG